jgi:hypothetical protein
MESLHFEKISTNISYYEESIKQFLSTLNSEMKYIAISIERIMGSRSLIAVYDGPQIVGLTGLEKRLFIFCTYVILNKKYQGKGLGKKLTVSLLKDASTLSRFIFSVMLIENIKSFHQHISAGAKLIGTRKGAYYLYWVPSGHYGFLYYWLVRLAFPFIKLYDLSIIIRP